MNLDKVSRDDWIVAGLAALLLIDLLFLAWFEISVSAGPITLSFTSTATGAPDGWLGVLAVLALLLLLADLAVERLSPQTSVPAIGGSRATTRFVLAAAAALFLFLKFLFHINHFSDLGFGFWAALVLTVALIYVSVLARQGRSVLAERSGPRTPTGPAGPPTA